ncbi:diaminopimelate epimerase [Methylotenera sp.]|uniref:diaminopimelate epimerase n=1 Tax=Methylotenera sp. TaxID=2051956 RepID=UPI002487AEBF|nr:diaminopimelate epimerase [Methylotenera sp.]MDI1298497.1 diaminopimelate epimerase [Methylotenera sp.]
MNLHFTKMQGAGNDFIVINGIDQPFQLTADQIQTLAHRQFGIGFDQLLLVQTSKVADFKYRIFNADGTEVAQCGNGARCFVRFVVDQKLSSKHEISVETASGIITPKLENNGLVTVNMGAPRLSPSEVPFIADTAANSYSLEVANQQIIISAVSMGNPHAVQIVDDVETTPVVALGSQIEVHPRFPERVNAGFMQIIDEHHIKLRVFERGSGETLACGTGACAAVVAGIQLGRLQSPVKVSAHGGELHITWQGGNSAVMMTGPAVTVFTGSIEI